jgi:hypothetical protein
MNELLKALAENDGNLEAPPAVENRLRAAFLRRYRNRKWPYVALAAAIALAIGVWPKAQNMEISVATPPVPVMPVARAAPRKVVHRQQPKEVMTEFYSLMEDAPPFERGELMRVTVTASAMRSVGLPVSEEHLDDVVQADVLVGEEGLARAIRFVNRP